MSVMPPIHSKTYSSIERLQCVKLLWWLYEEVQDSKVLMPEQDTKQEFGQVFRFGCMEEWRFPIIFASAVVTFNKNKSGVWGGGGGSYTDQVVGSVWKHDALTGYHLTQIPDKSMYGSPGNTKVHSHHHGTSNTCWNGNLNSSTWPNPESWFEEMNIRHENHYNNRKWPLKAQSGWERQWQLLCEKKLQATAENVSN